MSADEYIRGVNLLVNVGTDFDYIKAYDTLSANDKQIVDEHFDDNPLIAL